MENLEKLIDFFIETEALKKTFRYSTCPENVRDSSADHSWKLAFMALILNEKIEGVNSCRALQICLVHDLAESITGDIDSYRIVLGEITKEQKHKAEEKAMENIKKEFPKTGQMLFDLWQEFNECKTPEAKYAQALDKIEALVHLLSVGFIARRKEDGVGAELTAKYADNAVKEFPQLKPVLDIVKEKMKKEFEKQGFEWKNSYN